MFGGWFDNSKGPIGIDLGAHSVKLLQLGRREDGAVVAAAASRHLPADLPPDGPERNEALIQVIRQMLAGGGFSGRKVVSCLSAADVQHKNLRVPKMPAEELPEAIAFEASDRLKMPRDEFTLQFFDAGEVRQGEETRQEIILLAAQNRSITNHLDMLVQAGLQPVGVDAVPSALARSLASEQTAADEAPAKVILDVGYLSTKVLVVRRGRVMFFKMIDIAGKKLDETVAERLGLPSSEAAELRRKLQKPTAGEADATKTDAADSSGRGRDSVERTVGEALRAVASELAREVSLCLRYYSVTFRGARPDHAVLAGGEAYEPHLLKVFTDEAGIAVEPAKPFDSYDITKCDRLSGEGTNLSEWSVALGLALRPANRAALRGAA